MEGMSEYQGCLCSEKNTPTAECYLCPHMPFIHACTEAKPPCFSASVPAEHCTRFHWSRPTHPSHAFKERSPKTFTVSKMISFLCEWQVCSYSIPPNKCKPYDHKMRENAAILYTAAFPSNTSPIFAWGKLLLWMSDLIATWDTARTDVALFAGPNIVVKSLLFCPFFPDFWILHIYFPSQAFLEAYFSTCGFLLCWLLIRMKVPAVAAQWEKCFSEGGPTQIKTWSPAVALQSRTAVSWKLVGYLREALSVAHGTAEKRWRAPFSGAGLREMLYSISASL